MCGFFFIKTELNKSKIYGIKYFKIVSENYKNQEKTQKKIPIKQKKHPHIIAYSLERNITNIFQMHKKYIKTLLILYNMHKRKD